MIILKGLIVLGIIITAAIMLMGVATMTRGKEFNKKHGNKLMQARILSQFVTLFLVVVYLFLYT